MRLTSGWLRGLTIHVPKGLSTRPTSSRLRGAVLNMLQNEVGGARVLDLFAGSGAVGIEAISRGAAGAAFVEADGTALACLERNLAEIRRRSATQDRAPPEPLTAIRGDVFRVARREAARLGPFDIIWGDPPYSIVGDFLGTIDHDLAGLAAARSILVVEGPAEYSMPEVVGTDWVRWKERVQGAGQVVLWRRAEVET